MSEAPDPLIPVSPEPERMSPAGWVYPRTWEDRVNAVVKPLVRGLLALLGCSVLALAALWAVPSFVVARRPSYAQACQRALGDSYLASSLGQTLSCPTVPGFYRLDQETGDIYEWWVEGPRGRARVRAEVKDGAVHRFRVIQLDLAWLGG